MNEAAGGGGGDDDGGRVREIPVNPLSWSASQPSRQAWATEEPQQQQQQPPRLWLVQVLLE